MMKKIIYIIYLFLLSAGFISCSGEAPVVEKYASSRRSPAQDLGTLYPQIMTIYPGALQTLDVPQAYPTDIIPVSGTIVLVFSQPMTSLAIVKSNFTLYESLTVVDVDVTDSNGNLTSFYIRPKGKFFKENRDYYFRINKFATSAQGYELSFANLVQSPATTISPVDSPYVEYRFRTAVVSSTDTQPPLLFSSDPADGAVNIAISLSNIELYFTDNLVPMVNPATVDGSTLAVTNLTDNYDLSLSVTFDYNNPNFNHITITLLDALQNSKDYRIRLSVGNSIQDFRGNMMPQQDIFFSSEN